jgi:hypothetical protein
MDLRQQAAALLGPPHPRLVDEDAAHDARSDGKEMRAIVPRHILDVDEPYIGFADERSGLKLCPTRHLPCSRERCDEAPDKRAGSCGRGRFRLLETMPEEAR